MQFINSHFAIKVVYFLLHSIARNQNNWYRKFFIALWTTVHYENMAYIFQWLGFLIKPTLFFQSVVSYVHLFWYALVPARGQKLFTQNNKINVGFVQKGSKKEKCATAVVPSLSHRKGEPICFAIQSFAVVSWLIIKVATSNEKLSDKNKSRIASKFWFRFFNFVIWMLKVTQHVNWG